ncbi:L-threonylcarbamoyladenylate synthase [Paenibacillus tarimensis]
MDTKVWRITEKLESGDVAGQALQEAAGMLRAGQLVAFPTETVYGLGADARNTEAVERIFAAKGRPSDNPLIVHIADVGQLEGLVLPFGEIERKLMNRFWPGPLTLVLPVRPGAVSPRVTAGLDTVAVRMPAHKAALRLIAAAECPVAAPSANRSGRPSPTLADHVAEDLGGRIEGLVDGGPTGVGLESTVVEVSADGMIHVLRPGGVTAEELKEIGPVAALEPEMAGSAADSEPEYKLQAGLSSAAFSAARRGSDVCSDAQRAGDGQNDNKPAQSAPRSPGMKYTHYAPRGAMRLVKGEPEAVRVRIQEEVDAARRRGRTTGVLAYTEHAAQYRADAVLVCGSLARLETAAQGLYAVLREFDERGVQEIWAEACPEEGIGLALMNRLVKAAGHRIIEV